MAEETIERVFSVTLPARLKVTNIRGSVIVRSTEGDQITVKAVKDTSSGDAEDTVIRIDQAADGQVRVETDYQHHFSFWTRQPCRVYYTIGVPRQCALSVEVVAADADVQGLDGAVRIRSVSGNVKAGDMTGSIDFRTVSGDVRGHDLTGSLDLDTVSGNIILENSRVEAVHSKTVSGDVEVDIQPGNGPFEFRSVSGDVRLKLPSGSGCSASLSTQSGKLRSNGGASNMKEWGHGSYQAEYFGGGRRITLRSVSGDLDLNFFGEGGEPVRTEPPAAAPTKNVTEILDKIDSGELSVEDALKLLEK